MPLPRCRRAGRARRERSRVPEARRVDATALASA